MSVYEAGAFASEMSRNSDSGTAYRFTREGAEFAEADRIDAEAKLRGMGREIVGSFLESRVVDFDAKEVAFTGVIKVLPELTTDLRRELADSLSGPQGAVRIQHAEAA